MKHPALKLTALFCAVILWFYVVSQDTYKVQKTIPVQYVNLPPHLALAGYAPDSIPVVLEGKGIDLMRTSGDLGGLELDLSNAELGTRRYLLQATQFRPRRSGSLKVTRLLGQKSLELDVDARIFKKVPVRNRCEPEAADNYVLSGNMQLNPDKVEISGARKTITRVYEIDSEALHITDLKKDTAVALQLTAPPQARLEQSQVTLKIEVQKLSRLRLDSLPVRLVGRNRPVNYFLKPAWTSLILSGGEKNLQDLDRDDINIFVEYSRFSIEDKEELRPTVSLPGPIQSWHLEPELFSLDSLSTPPSDTNSTVAAEEE